MNLLARHKRSASRSQEPKRIHQEPPQAELTSILRNTATNLGRLPSLPIDKLILYVQNNAVDGITRIMTERLTQHNQQAAVLQEHIDSIDRDLGFLDNPDSRVEAATLETKFAQDQLRSQMLLNQDKVLAPKEGIVSEELLEEAQLRESQTIESSKERLQFFNQQIREARHPRLPMVSPKSYTVATILILLLLFCLNGVLAKLLDLTQVEMVLLSAIDIACVLGTTLSIQNKLTEQTLNKQELQYESQQLRAAS